MADEEETTEAALRRIARECVAVTADRGALVAELVGLRTEADQLRTENEGLAASHDLMAAQFRVMQREKEHGWQEADRHEARADAAEARAVRAEQERDELRKRIADELEVYAKVGELPWGIGVGWREGFKVAAHNIRTGGLAAAVPEVGAEEPTDGRSTFIDRRRRNPTVEQIAADEGEQ